MPPEDRIRLQHIIEAVETVADFSTGRAQSDLDTDRMLLLALTRALEIMGEAAARLSAETRAGTPAIP